MMLEQLAYLHGTPTARGILKAEAADFVVNEDLGFEPCGEGEHIFVRVRKTGENTAWVAGLLAILFWKRRKQADGDAGQAPLLSLADQLRPYVQQAQEGTLDAGGRAAMERLVLGFWRERLGLTGQPVAQAITTLRAHPEAGALLRKVEHWLHAPPAPGQADASADTAALLAPYLKS